MTNLKNDKKEARCGGSELNAGLGVKPVSMAALDNAMREIGLLPKLDQWVLVSPEGQMYKGTIEQITPFILKKYAQLITNTQFGVNNFGSAA